MNTTETSKTIADAEQAGITFTDEAKAAFREMEACCQRLMKVAEGVPSTTDSGGRARAQIIAACFVGIAGKSCDSAAGVAILNGRTDQIIGSIVKLIEDMPKSARAVIVRRLIGGLS